MMKYWIKHRLLFTAAFAIALAVMTVFLFVFPTVEQNALTYNTQSLYKNTSIDFVVPEPSFEQVTTLPGTNGVASVYPFYMTKAEVGIHGRERTTTVLIANQELNLNITMYNDSRLIKKSAVTCENPILVDWMFCRDTSSDIGDKVTIMIAGQKKEFCIYAIYETNSLYAGGAILLPVSTDQINAISEQSGNNGYSGMYVVASEYNPCRQYLTTDYRPLGRLRDRTQFANDEQYQIHYDAIMNSGYSNEITDFRIMANDTKSSNGWMIWLGALLTIIAIIVFNVILEKRGCEKTYFTKQCIPAGKNVKPYYLTSFIAEVIMCLLFYMILLSIRISGADNYIPGTAIGICTVIVPVALVIAEIFAIVFNFSTLKTTHAGTITIPIQSTKGTGKMRSGDNDQLKEDELQTEDKVTDCDQIEVCHKEEQMTSAERAQK